MKILIVTGIYPPDIGGPATYSKLIYTELPKYDIETKLVVFSDLKKYPRGLRHLLFLFRILKKSKGVDLYYVQDPVSTGWPTLLASILTGKKYLLKIVGDYAWEQGSQKSRVADTLDIFSAKSTGYDFFVYCLKKIQTAVANRAVGIVVPSFYLKKIVSNWGITPDRINVVYNSFEFKGVPENKDQLRKDLDLNGQVVITVGRLVPWKGFEALIKLLGGQTDINLLIVGSGPDYDKLNKIITDKGFNNIKLLGALDQDRLFRYIKSADVFLLNTAYEGFSHQLLEVMAIGVPIITTRVGGNPELIGDGINGLLVEYNDSVAIKKALTKVLTDKYFSDSLTVNGFKKITEFGEEKMLGELSKIIKNQVL